MANSIRISVYKRFETLNLFAWLGNTKKHDLSLGIFILWKHVFVSGCLVRVKYALAFLWNWQYFIVSSFVLVVVVEKTLSSLLQLVVWESLSGRVEMVRVDIVDMDGWYGTIAHADHIASW